MTVHKILLASLPAIVLGLGACEDKGTAESAGQEIDQAVEKAKEAVDPQGPAERAGEKIDESVEKAKE
ncbi:MAG: Rv0909 family putative TA system antitoxin [Pseudomonadota bacterium]|nr:Rv0909 family putative TA system antitoxin [Pseudomonadota bacterium]